MSLLQFLQLKKTPHDFEIESDDELSSGPLRYGEMELYGFKNRVSPLVDAARGLERFGLGENGCHVRFLGKILVMADYKIVRLLTEHIPGAMDVLRQSFFPDEKLCNCVRILQDSEELHTDSKYKVTKASKELEDLAFETVKEGVSFCAVDVKTGEVLGLAINKIQMKPNPGKPSYLEQYTKQHIREPSAKAFVDFLLDVDSRYDLFGDDGDCYFEILYLAVKSPSWGRGIGTSLVAASAKLGQDLKLRNAKGNSTVDVKSDAKEFKNSQALNMAPKCVSAIFSSRFSQKCGRRAGYDEVLIVPYKEFTYNGKNYADVTGPDHPHCTLSVKFLN